MGSSDAKQEVLEQLVGPADEDVSEDDTDAEGDETATEGKAEAEVSDDKVTDAEVSEAALAAEALAETETETAEKPEGDEAEAEADAEAEAAAKAAGEVSDEQKPEGDEGEASDRGAEKGEGTQVPVKTLQAERTRRRQEAEARHQAEIAQAKAEAKLEVYQEMGRKPDAEQGREPQTRNEILAAIRERDGLTGTDALNLDQLAEYNERCDQMQERNRRRSFEQARDQFIQSNRASAEAALAKYTTESAGKGRSFSVVTTAAEALKLLTDSDKEKIKASDNFGESLYSTSLERLTEAGLITPAKKVTVTKTNGKEGSAGAGVNKTPGAEKPKQKPAVSQDEILEGGEQNVKEILLGPKDEG